MPRRRAQAGLARRGAAVALCSGAVLIAACSSSSPTSSGTPSVKPSVAAHSGSAASNTKVDCAAVDSLRSSLESLSKTSLSPGSASVLAADLRNVQTQLAKLKGQGGGAFSSQINELSASVNEISKAAAELNTDPQKATQDLTTALNGLKGKAGPMISEMNSVCPMSTK